MSIGEGDDRYILIVNREHFISYQTCYFNYGHFYGKGWYYIRYFFERCPRNCCDKDSVEIITASEKAKRIQQDIDKLSVRLEKAKEYIKKVF